jgi:NAD(P)-dependent dehydrogenase (short-subunit alcohol dehydrogenase family)
MARRSLVIGGRRGIGAAVVRALLARGDAVTFTYRTDPGDLEALRAAFPQADIATAALDLADRAAVEAFAVQCEAGPAYDALVQVGGTTYDALAAVMDQTQAERAMQVNYFAFARIARAVLRPMLRARHGRIVAIGSIIGGMTASQGNAAYAATKAAVLAYVRTLAIESARRGITVNYIAPGLVDTEMMAPFAAHRAAVEARVPAGRFATPAEIAAVAAFLTSPEASYVNGAVIPVDGGLTAGVGLPRG